MDEPRTSRSGRRLAILLALPVAAVALWASVAAAGGSGPQGKSRGDVAKPAAKAQGKQHARAGVSRHQGDRDCPLKDAGIASADI